MATTPGPWRVDPDDATSVLASDDRVTIVACVTGASSNPVTVADAHLIAAAPDLLAALKDVLANGGPDASAKSCGHDFYCVCSATAARAAIAKAEGL